MYMLNLIFFILYSNLNEYVIESFEWGLNTNMHQFLHLLMQIFNPNPTVLISLETNRNWLRYSTNIQNSLASNLLHLDFQVKYQIINKLIILNSVIRGHNIVLINRPSTVVVSALLIIGDNCQGMYIIDHCHTGPPSLSIISPQL